ncbi:MAG: alpha/beta fold hydrolase [Anaerolineae bacterium]
MLLASIRRLGVAAVYDRLEEVPVPVRIVVGARDVSTPPDQAAALARRIPRVEVIVVGEAGHHVMTDAPGTLGRLIAEAVGQ